MRELDIWFKPQRYGGRVSSFSDLFAWELADLLQQKTVSATEVVNHFLEQARVDEYGAFISIATESALRKANEIDQARSAGKELPPFAGVPIAIKDLTPIAGEITTFGSKIMADFVPDRTAYVAELLFGAGFVNIGKTNTPEFGLSSYTDNALVGPACAPADKNLNAGGSSGGAAVAVARKLVPLAQASDGGGSIRIPASCCSVFGFKPSRGRISAGPSGSDVTGLTIDGPITRSVKDAALFMDVVAKPMPGDIRPLPVPRISFEHALEQRTKRLRIARWSKPYIDGITTSNDAIAAWEHTSKILESHGHEIVDIENPFPAELEEQFNIVWSTAIAGVEFPSEAEEMLLRNTRYWRDRGKQTSGIELMNAMRFLESKTREVITSLMQFDVFLTPTLALPPQPLHWFTEPADPKDSHWRELLFTPFTALYNMTGQPAANLPLWNNPAGLPIGTMIATHAGQDALALQLSYQLLSK